MLAQEGDSNISWEIEDSNSAFNFLFLFLIVSFLFCLL